MDQPHHEECLAALNRSQDLVVSPLVIAELDYLVTQRVGSSIAMRILRAFPEYGFEIAPFPMEDYLAALDVMSNYADLEVGLTDASLVVLAKRYKTNEILTLDQHHFRAMRGLDGRNFRLLPFDLDD